LDSRRGKESSKCEDLWVDEMGYVWCHWCVVKDKKIANSGVGYS